MKLESVTINTELGIFYSCDTAEKKASYIMELVYGSKEFNRNIPELLLEFASCNPEWTPFIMGFIIALKIVNEQERINQENELERIFKL
jgi:hypothetical protein